MGDWWDSSSSDWSNRPNRWAGRDWGWMDSGEDAPPGGDWRDNAAAAVAAEVSRRRPANFGVSQQEWDFFVQNSVCNLIASAGGPRGGLSPPARRGRSPPLLPPGEGSGPQAAAAAAAEPLAVLPPGDGAGAQAAAAAAKAAPPPPPPAEKAASLLPLPPPPAEQVASLLPLPPPPPPPPPSGPPPGQTVAAPVPPAYDVDFFTNYGERLGASYQQHNQALKYFRSTTENSQTPFQSDAKVFDNMAPTMVRVCDHAAKGTSFTFKDDEEVPWRWQEMVATLREEDMREVVLGPRSSGALVGCSLEVRPNSYDHKRRATVQATKVNIKLPVWDFVLRRDDGTGVRLHPNWGDRKVSALDLAPHADTVEPPRKGIGRSDGPGTFRNYKDLGVQRTYRFDAAKEKPRQQEGPAAAGPKTTGPKRRARSNWGPGNTGAAASSGGGPGSAEAAASSSSGPRSSGAAASSRGGAQESFYGFPPGQ